MVLTGFGSCLHKVYNSVFSITSCKLKKNACFMVLIACLTFHGDLV